MEDALIFDGHQTADNDVNPRPADKPASLRSRLRSLLQDLPFPQCGPRSASSTPSTQVLLDIELDGSRYQLLRTTNPHPSDEVALSPREQQIVRLVAEGLPTKTIAHVLHISAWTVGTHLRRIFAKLGVGSRAAMIASLSQAGFALALFAPVRDKAQSKTGRNKSNEFSIPRDRGPNLELKEGRRARSPASFRSGRSTVGSQV